MSTLNTVFAGLNLKNPIIAASSGLTQSVSQINELANAGVAAVVLKSIFEEEILMEMEQVQHQMVGQLSVFPETRDFLDEEPHIDLIRDHIQLIAEAKASVNIPIIASINCVSNQKWTYIAAEFEKAGADAIELNLFSLPSDMNRPAGEIEQMYLDLVDEVCNSVKIPVILKVSPYFTSLGQMLKKFSLLPIKGIVLFNRYYSPDIDIVHKKLVSSFVLSAPSEIALPLRWTAITSQQLNISLAASTGIHSTSDVIKLLLAGSSAVQIASVIYESGAEIIGKMLSELQIWMQQNDYHSIGDFKGKLSLGRQNDAAEWERVQFMREFRNFIK